MKRILFVFGLLVLVNSVSFGQVNYYLKIDGIEGEAKDKAHNKWIQIESFQQAIEKPSNQSRAGKTVFSSMSISKMLDASSVKLAEAVAQGKRYKNVEIHCTKNGTTFYSYKLTDVVITNYTISGASGEVPSEEVALSFGMIEAIYHKISPRTGKEESKVIYKFDTIRGK
jgi:type VI secretion system secreted protein Hcp